MSQYGNLVAQLKLEDEADIRYIIRNFKEDGYTRGRLLKVLDNEKALVKVLSKKKFSCRMNNNVINAIERILNEPELINL